MTRRIKNIRWNHLAAAVVGLLLIVWVLNVVRTAEYLPTNFSYQANVISTDDLYDPVKMQFSGKQQSQTQLVYETTAVKGSTLNIKNSFKVSKLSGEPIFTVERNYAINRKTGQHVRGGDHDREGFLLAPRPAPKGEFTYWHVNYDVPIKLQYVSEEAIQGLAVYRYQAEFQADQSKELSNLPDVPAKRGIQLDAKLQLWIEPTTGRAVKYQDQATAYYYDRASGQRLEPWNQFTNHTDEGSISQQVAAIKSLKRGLWYKQVIVPIALLSLLCILLMWPYMNQIFRSQGLLWLIGAVLLLSFAIVYRNAVESVQTNVRTEFESRASAVEQAIVNRLNDHQQVLYGAQGFIVANGGHVTREQWRAYAASLGIRSRLSGVAGISFSQKIGDAKALASHVRDIRAQGLPDYNVFPAGNRAEYHSIIYIEPLDGMNQRAVGYDLHTEAKRAAAMDKARDSGQPAVSGKIQLVQDRDEAIQAGFLMLLPVYRPGAPLMNVEQRRTALAGFVAVPFRAADFMAGLFGGLTANGLNIQLYDESIAADRLMYSSTGIDRADSRPQLSKQVTLNIPSHQWQLYLTPTPAITASIDKTEPLNAIVRGIILTLLLLGLVYSLQTAGQRARTIAAKITASLRASEQSARQSALQSQAAEAATARATADLRSQNEVLDNTKRAVLNILEDLEEEKTKLLELTERDQALIYSIGDSIIVTDEYGQITRVNTALENMIGFSANELQGGGINAVIPLRTLEGEPVPADKRVVFEALTTGKPAHGSYQIIRKDKTSFVGDMTAAPYLINGRPAGAVVTIRDISQQVAIDKAKTEFVSLASHQLRTPLSTINWYLEMVLGGDVGKLTAEQQQYLSEVYNANQRMVTLVNALLNVSRIDLGTFAIEPEPTDLKKTVSNVLIELQSQIQKKQMKLITEFAPELKPYSADPKLTHIIFQNLISNAVKYTPEKGEIKVGIKLDKNQLVITVADNGYGIPKAQESKIFTKLFRADNVVTKETDGTGLGLYLIKAIVEEAGGDIGFTSEENKGTTFTIHLPLSGMKKRSGTRGLSTTPTG